MENFKVRWMEAGRVRVSAVSYDAGSAEGRKQQLEDQGATDVEIVPVKLGEEL